MPPLRRPGGLAVMLMSRNLHGGPADGRRAGARAIAELMVALLLVAACSPSASPGVVGATVPPASPVSLAANAPLVTAVPSAAPAVSGSPSGTSPSATSPSASTSARASAPDTTPPPTLATPQPTTTSTPAPAPSTTPPPAPAPTATPVASQPASLSVYGDIGNPAGSSNPLLVHPAQFLLTEDGSWALIDLHWSGWNTKAASATGFSYASDCSPSCVAGAWLSTPARITLSSPGIVLGHDVYRCLAVTVAAFPRSDVHGCLQHVGSLYIYPIVLPTAPTLGAQFSWPSAHAVGASLNGVVLCTMSATLASCWSTPPAAPYGEIASLATTGPASICVLPACGSGVPDMTAPVLPEGSSLTDGPFVCSSASSGVTCEVAKTRRGFRFNATSATLVG
jgi:hypothetical protein